MHKKAQLKAFAMSSCEVSNSELKGLIDSCSKDYTLSSFSIYTATAKFPSFHDCISIWAAAPRGRCTTTISPLFSCFFFIPLPALFYALWSIAQCPLSSL